MSARTRIKICGITRVEDALTAAEFGVDAIGLVFYEKSPRCITSMQALTIAQALPPFITKVGLFVNATESQIAKLLSYVSLDCLQFHGEESPEQCGKFSLPYIKAIPMGSQQNPLTYAALFPDAAGFLLDSNQIGQQGGTGEIFDWSKIPTGFPAPLILAGGLTPINVRQAIEVVRPYAVDVSSGVEMQKGVKDKAKMLAFVKGVRDADVR